MAKEIESEVVSKQFFESLGFTIRERDFEGKKKGADFFIELDECIQSVEAKMKMGSWVQLLKPQLDRLKNGGLLAIVNEGKVEVRTVEDIEINEIILYRATLKEGKNTK